MMFCADWPHMRPGSTRPIHSWKIIGEILLLWSGNCIGTATFSRKMHLNWKFCIIPCTGHFIWLFHFQLGCIHFCTYICVFTAKEENILDFGGKCCAADHSTIAWLLSVAVLKSAYCMFLEKFSNFILHRSNKEICLFLRNFPLNLNLNMWAIWFPV
jgi:hypothetical protein